VKFKKLGFNAPLKKSADLGDLKKWPKLHWGETIAPCGGAYASCPVAC